MRQAIGIDTGGTYTDAVLVDPASGHVLSKAKALTTPHDLSIGIAQAIDGLGQMDPEQVRLVAISTTLATNAIVEGQGGRVGLILIGYDEEIVKRAGLTKRLPVEKMCLIAGGHDVKGMEVHPLDDEAARRAVLDFHDQVDAMAVSGYFSVMNPEHELRVRQIIADLTDAPVVCGHELSSMLNSLKRVSTAVLNARLLPMIQNLLDSVNKVLAERGIGGLLMVVKGDGSLMPEKTARQRPVETILSGPAASAIGGRHLSGQNSAIIVDMGGTTTDVAILHDGQLWTNPAGAMVGGWQTSVMAADLRTIGLGGDSHIRVEKGNTLCVGPRRVIPLCRIGGVWPQVARELEGAIYAGAGELDTRPTDFLTIVRPAEGITLSETEKAILQALRHGPRSIASLRRSMSHFFVPSERLEELGILRRAGLTPTDILWSPGSSIGGSGTAARAGTQVVAKQLDLSVEELARRVLDQVVDRVTEEVLDKLVASESGHSLLPAAPAWAFLLKQVLGHEVTQAFECQVRVRQPIVAIGAPVTSFMPQVADKLHTPCLIPLHSEVGNAVGAVVASITHSVEILVQPYIQGAGTVTYLVHAPQEVEQFTSFARAVGRAEQIATELARKATYRARAEAVSVKVDRKQVNLGSLSEMTVRATATGRPHLTE